MQPKPLSIWGGNPKGACLFVFEHYFWVNTARVNVTSQWKPPLISLQEHLHHHNSSINVTLWGNSNTLTSAVQNAAGRNCKCVKQRMYRWKLVENHCNDRKKLEFTRVVYTDLSIMGQHEIELQQMFTSHQGISMQMFSFLCVFIRYIGQWQIRMTEIEKITNLGEI